MLSCTLTKSINGDARRMWQFHCPNSIPTATRHVLYCILECNFIIRSPQTSRIFQFLVFNVQFQLVIVDTFKTWRIFGCKACIWHKNHCSRFDASLAGIITSAIDISITLDVPIPFQHILTIELNQFLTIWSYTSDLWCIYIINKMSVCISFN